jgi:hypothetical protein
VIGSIGTVLLRQIPQQLMAGIVAGDYRVAGSVIQQVQTGRIVGHLQETSALAGLAASGPPGIALAGLELVGQGVAIVQNEQIKAGIELLKSLQLAGLALTGVGIGVSIAGTALLAYRIGRLEAKVNQLMPAVGEIARGIEALKAEHIAADLTRLRTLADQVEEAWLPSATTAEWTAIAREAHFLADSFERRAQGLHSDNDPLVREPFIDAFALASSLRVTARMAAGQDDMARQAASARATTLVTLGAPVQLVKMVMRAVTTVPDPETPHWKAQLDKQVTDARTAVEIVRSREVAAAASFETLAALERQQIRGRDWLEASRNEMEQPLLLLSVPQG